MTASSPDKTVSPTGWISGAAQAWKGNQRSARYGLEETAKLGRTWTRRLVGCVPELLLSRAIAGRKSELLFPWRVDNGSCPVHITGVLSCHALGAMGDTVDLLADLGRTARIASALGKQKNFSIMLAGQEWSSYNRIARDYGIADFAEVEEWRIRLYTALGCQVQLCDLEYEVGGRRKVKDLARKYVELARELFGRDRIGRPLSRDEVNAMRAETVPGELALLKIGIIADRIGPDWEVIQNVVEYLNRLDVDTFTYYLTQRFQQYAFRDFLKVAMRSEKNFDLPFLELDRNVQRRGVERALYFKPYILREDPERPQFVVPYYFPSGNLYVGKQVPLATYRDAVMLLDTLDDLARALAIFRQMPYPSNARLLGDLLSFVHVWLFPLADGSVARFLDKKIETIRQHERPDEAKSFEADVSDVDAEFAESWRLYATRHGIFETLILQWSDNVWNDSIEAMPLPYYFFPYWWLRPENATDAHKADDVLEAVLALLVRTIDPPTSPREE